MTSFGRRRPGSLFEELDGLTLAPEVEVRELALRVDRRAPHRLQILVARRREAGRGAETEAQVRQRFERLHERRGRERTLVRLEARDEDARRDVALERG